MAARHALAVLLLSVLLAVPPSSAQGGSLIDEGVSALGRTLEDAEEAAACLASDPECPASPVGSPVACLFQPVIPETPLYAVVWHCATGGAPEPIGALTGCTVDTPGLADCLREAVDLAGRTVQDAVSCLLGPHIPETFLYYIVWGCLTGGAYGEPVRDTTGCTIEFGLRLECSG